MLEVNEPEFFDTAERLRLAVERNTVYTVTDETSLLGMGVKTPVIEGRPAVDVGMLVAPAARGKGLGAHIVQSMAELALTEGHTPICGCAGDNIASLRSLENAGFIPEHRLLEFFGLTS